MLFRSYQSRAKILLLLVKCLDSFQPVPEEIAVIYLIVETREEYLLTYRNDSAPGHVAEGKQKRRIMMVIMMVIINYFTSVKCLKAAQLTYSSIFSPYLRHQ